MNGVEEGPRVFVQGLHRAPPNPLVRRADVDHLLDWRIGHPENLIDGFRNQLEAPLAHAQSFLGPLAIGDVADHRIVDDVRSQFDRGGADFDIHQGPVLAPVACLEGGRSGPDLSHPLQYLVSGHVVVPVPDVQLPHFLHAVPEHAGEALVRFNRLAARVEDDDAVLGLLEEHAPPGDLLGQGGRGPLALGDVVRRGIDQLLVSHRRGAKQEPKLRTVLAQPPEFALRAAPNGADPRELGPHRRGVIRVQELGKWLALHLLDRVSHGLQQRGIGPLDIRRRSR